MHWFAKNHFRIIGLISVDQSLLLACMNMKNSAITVAMPDCVFTNANGLTVNPDTSERPVVAVAVSYTKGHAVNAHSHKRGQLMFVISGSMRIDTEEGSWVTPPGRAFWVPSNVPHSVTYTQAAQLRTAYVRADLLASLPVRCCVLKLSTLLRELVISAVDIGWDYEDQSREYRLMEVLVDQIAIENEAPLFLPEGRDPRLKKITAALHENPGDNRPIEAWSNYAGASPRTLSRLFLKETTLTFSAWRQQLCLIRAVEMLVEGQSVTKIAFSLGYSSTGSFTTMFTRVMGEPPTVYLNRWDHPSH